MKPYYNHKGIQIYLGDCRDILPELEPVDLVLTDPPYGVLKAEWDSKFPIGEIWKQVHTVLKKGGNLIVIPGEHDLPNKIGIISNIFNYQWVIPWYKPNAMQFGKTGYSKHSLIWWFSSGEPNEKPSKMIDIISIPMGLNEDRHPGHPCPKPVSLMKHLLINFASDTVLDPFMGSGTTLVAAKQLGRKAIGIEIEEKYCEIAVRRLSQEMLPF